MLIDLTPWLILWGLITTAVVGLALWRLLLGLHELGGIHLGPTGEKALRQEAHSTRVEERLELWGKTLTVVSAIVILAIAAAWLHNAWVKFGG